MPIFICVKACFVNGRFYALGERVNAPFPPAREYFVTEKPADDQKREDGKKV